MLSDRKMVKVNISRDMVEEGFIPIGVLPDFFRAYGDRVYATDMEGRSIILEQALSNGTLTGFYIDIDVPNFSIISLMFYLGDNDGLR